MKCCPALLNWALSPEIESLSFLLLFQHENGFQAGSSPRGKVIFLANLQFMSEGEKRRLSMILLRVWVLSSCFHFSSVAICVLILNIVLEKIPAKYKIIWVKFIRTFLCLCLVDSFHSICVVTVGLDLKGCFQPQWFYEQNKSSEVLWTEKVQEVRWDPACSNPGSDRGSFNLLSLIFMCGKGEKGHFRYEHTVKRGRWCVWSPPACSVLATAEHV